MSRSPTDRGRAPEAEPGKRAALRARDAIEEALFTLPVIPLELDREGLRDRMLRAIQYLYIAIDNPELTAAHLHGLTEARAVVMESRELLGRSGAPGSVEPLSRALERLDAAAESLRLGAEATADLQFARRNEIAAGDEGSGPPPPRAFRASSGVPALHALARLPLLPHLMVEPAEPMAVAAPPPPSVPRPQGLDALKAFAADALSGALERRLHEVAVEEASLPPPAENVWPVAEPAIEEVDVLRRLARDCLEDVANLRNLRKPNALESWLDQAPFEQRLLDNLDAFAALGGSVLSQISLFYAEAKAPDPERAFAAALTLGCIEGSDTVRAAVMNLKQSPPETFPGWVEGFWLAPSPAIDIAMADLCTSARPELVAVALDVLHARGASPPDEVIEALLERAELPVAQRVARALATSLPRQEAIAHLVRLCTTDEEQLFLAAVESLLRRGHRPAVHLLRDAVDAPTSPARAGQALTLLCLVGDASDLDRLLAAVDAKPTARLAHGLGRFGHVDALGALLGLLSHEDPDLVAAAAGALERITGAGLRETVEEPWEIELPPEAAEAGGMPVPTRKLERVVTDRERWSTWVHGHARRLDRGRKTRGGVPFTPLQIVDELESRHTRPAAREEAALEIVLVTGLCSPFSPHDWVARQCRHLAELRARVAALKATPSAWSHGLGRGPARSSPKLSWVLGSASTPVPPSPGPGDDRERRGPDAWPSGKGADEVLSARSPILEPGHPEGAAFAVLATGQGAPHSQAPVPAIVWTEPTGTYAVGDHHGDLTRTIDAFAPNAPLPFRPGGQGTGELRDIGVSEQAPAGRALVDLGQTTAGSLLPAPPVLPFHTTDATGSGTARYTEPLPSASVGRTVSPPLSPTAPVLPFHPAKQLPELDIGNPVPVPGHPPDASTSLTMTRSVPVTRTGQTMPFRQPADDPRPTPAVSRPAVGPVHGSNSPSLSAPSSPSQHLSPPAAEAALSLAQYASLCAELAVFPWAAEAIFQRHGLQSQQMRVKVDSVWKERLGRDTAAYGAWQEMYRRYHDYWTKRGSPFR